jgi:catechol 2,3-dioxygenase-like lactoylglutathione lyase family enzyme
LANRTIDQIGLLTDDLEAAVSRWGTGFGLAPWNIYRYDAGMASLELRGEPGAFAIRLALSSSTPQVELIEPLEGPSIYHEWMDEHGPGLHHVGLFVDSIADLLPEMSDAGHELLQRGSGYGLEGDGGFAYFDTLDAFGVVTELIEVPHRRRTPDLVAAAGGERLLSDRLDEESTVD